MTEAPSKGLIDSLDRIYVKADYDWYDQLSAQPLRLPDELLNLMKRYRFQLNPPRTEFTRHRPLARFFLDLGSFAEDSFSISYRSELLVSKLYPAYSLQFYYTVENRDPDTTFPTLVGGDDEPLTTTQYRFQDELVATAARLGWVRLLHDEREHPYPPAGEDVSLWTALSYDLLERCPD